MDSPQYTRCSRMELRRVTTVLKALRESDGVIKNPHAKKLVGHEEVAQCLEAMWPSDHEGCVCVCVC